MAQHYSQQQSGTGYNPGGFAPPPGPPHPNYNPGQTNPYAPSYPQQQPDGGNSYADYKGGNEGYERFKPKKKIKDPIFLVLFLAQLAGFAAVSGLAINTWIQQGGLGGDLGPSSTGQGVTLNRHTAYLLLLVTAAALLLSALYLLLVRTFTSIILKVTLVLSIILNIGIAAFMWAVRYYSGAIIFSIIAIFSILAFWGFWARIPLATLLLQVVLDVAKHHKSVYVVAFCGLMMQAALSVWYVFTVAATYAKWTPNNPSCSNYVGTVYGGVRSATNCSSGTVAGLIFFETFSFLWTSQVIANIVLSTLAGGPFGAWYYYGPQSDGMMPKHPTRSAFIRASTLSLGSIAFGSLIVAVLELLRLFLQAAANNSDSGVGAILACCAACVIGCIEGLVEWFNRYAYIEIALYGKPYIPAAKDTWRLIKDRGIDALINDCLVGMALNFGAYIVGILCGLFSYIYLRYTHPSYNQNGQYTAPVLLFGFLIGIACSLTLSSAIEAGVSTIFVGLAEDPQVLALRAPALFAMIQERYPRVVQGVV